MRPFTFTVTVEVERTSGPFASRDELAGQITEALESGDPGSLATDAGGDYETVSWEVSGA
jgi:hypothetical protein